MSTLKQESQNINPGWQSLMLNSALEKIRANEPLPEDRRAMDWIYLLPDLSHAKVCVIGAGGSAALVMLSQLCHSLTIIDLDSKQMDFLKIIKNQEKINNLKLISIKKHWMNELATQGPWDLIIYKQSIMGDERKFSSLIEDIRLNLNPEGWVYTLVANRLSIQAMVQPTPPPKYDYRPLTLTGYRKLFKKAGFKNCQFYAPVPHFDGTPLMNLTLDEKGAINFFFKNIFPLFEMVSPESKKAYQREYQLARLAVRIGLTLGLCRYSRYFLSGFGILAQI